jgi:hypothetical protein
MVGGAGYMAGKSAAKRGAQESQQESQQMPAPAPAPAPAAGLDPGVIEQLKQLAELRDSGVLTPEEFDAQKTKLLGS